MKRLMLGALLLCALILPVTSAHAVGVNDFTIDTYDIRYTLGRDKDGRSTLKTVETITAAFSPTDQNHGIERAIPQKYDNHPVRLHIDSVKKTDGSDWKYSTYVTNDNLVLRIGDADRYVHGSQTYVLTYTQHDVTKYYGDTKHDEFYWDTNGTDWKVPIRHLSVNLQLNDGIDTSLTGNAYCYSGASGAADACKLAHAGNTYSALGDNLQAGENITLAIGFNPHTFMVYKQNPIDTVFAAAKFIWFGLWLLGFAAIFWVANKWSAAMSRKKELGTIVPEYLPPSDASITTSASLLDAPTGVFAAQLLDLAVRHYLRLYQLEKSGFLGFKSKDYEIEIIRDISDLRAEEREVLDDIFGGVTTVGTRLSLSTLKNNSTVYAQMLDNDKKLKELVRGQYGLRAKDARQASRFRKLAVILLVIAVLTLNPMFGFAALWAFIGSLTPWMLTDKGLALSRYLKGLKMYIEVAEVERLKMLQSPDGAQKVAGLNPDDKTQLVKVYERVLPYAVLFGQEKQWNQQIGSLYEAAGQVPDWYSSPGTFNALAFSSAMSGFNTSASYSSASESSSGGSSGGGSSGGGGGGGGGGGW